MKSLIPAIIRGAFLALVFSANAAFAAFGTSVPISAELATNIANSLFPQTVQLSDSSLYMSDPVVLYTNVDAARSTADARPRLRLQLNVQSLRRQSDNSLKATAPGQAELSGELGYDPDTLQILLLNPSVDKLELDPLDPNKQALQKELDQQWAAQVTNPMRVDLPPHPYLIPFRQGIKDIRLDQQGIVVDVLFE